MKRSELFTAFSDVLDHVPEEFQAEAFAECLEQYHRDHDKGERFEEIKRAIYEAVKDAMVNYSNDKEITLYDALNDAIVDLRIRREEEYERAIRERDAAGYMAVHECPTTTEKE